MSAHHHGVERLRTYQVMKNQTLNCTIKEALLATSAIPGIFKPLVLEEFPGLNVTYLAANRGCSNPTSHMLEEAREIFPNRHIACIVSLGAGQAQTASILGSNSRVLRDPEDLVKTLELLAKDCETKAQEIAKRFEKTTDVYFRFNVEQGLHSIRESDWQRASEVVAHTSTFNRASENDWRLDRVAAAIIERTEYMATSLISEPFQFFAFITSLLPFSAAGVVPYLPDQIRIIPCPPPSPDFTGRVRTLEMMREYFIGPVDGQRGFILCGLGGSGKTQIARMFIKQYGQQ
jgi:hypothetical protein